MASGVPCLTYVCVGRAALASRLRKDWQEGGEKKIAINNEINSRLCGLQKAVTNLYPHAHTDQHLQGQAGRCHAPDPGEKEAGKQSESPGKLKYSDEHPLLRESEALELFAHVLSRETRCAVGEERES